MTKQTKKPKGKKNTLRQIGNALMAPVSNQRLAGIPNFNNHFAFPTMRRVTLAYSEVVGVQNSTTANVLGAASTFVPNSLYAPIVSGHQPYSFDQLCSANGPYTKYKVLGFKVKITLVNQSSPNPLHVFIRLRNITDNYDIAGKTIEDVSERQGSKMIVVPTGIAYATTTVHVPDLSVLFNWSKEQYSADQTSSVGTYGTSPDRLVNLQIASSNPAGTTQYFVNAMFEYMLDAVFFERQAIAGS